MIPTKTEDIEITSTVQGEEIRMQVDADATEHIIAMLTDLYSDSEMAIIREVSTNALDSHVEAGQTRPIEVMTPTPLSPQYKVQDWGTGLNAEDFRNIYSLYGKSTKTNTNDQTGSLGLGCKAPLTYTNQFTVVGVKNGIKTSAMVSRDEDGIPTIKIVNESPTDEPNGATVTIVTNHNHTGSLRTKAGEFFQFWPKGTVLLNGEEPKTYAEGATSILQVLPEAFLRTGQLQGQSYVIMCNVAYPLKSEYTQGLGLQYQQSVIFHVEPGTVHFTPSREALNYTRKTIKVIEDLRQRYLSALLKAAQAEIDAQPTKREGMDKAITWAEQLSRHIKGAEFTYKGATIPFSITCPDQLPQTYHSADGKEETRMVSAGFTVSEGRQGYGQMSKSHKVDKLTYRHHRHAIFIYGWDRGMTPTTKRKMWAWCEQNSINPPSAFVMTKNKVIGGGWIDPKRMVHWDTIDQIKLPKKVALRDGKIAGSYFVRVHPAKDKRAHEMMANEIDTTAPVFYCDNDSEMRMTFDHLLTLEVYDKFTIVIIPANRLAKFKRLFPEAQNGRQAEREIFEAWWDSLSKTTRDAIVIQRATSAPVVYTTQIIDPEIRRFTKLLKVDTRRERDILAKKFSHRYDIPTTWTNPLKRYPLYAATHNIHRHSAIDLKQHNTLYINSVYKELYANA